ncbi:MAG: hypothetical protein ABSC19_09530 [Syntrophorhabdales bacterium]
MKRKWLLWLVLGLASLLFALPVAGPARADDGDATPLPDDIKIEPPGADVAPPIAGFSGAWQGQLEVC